ncbi:glycosyl hydrolase [Olivibacter sitiensis]|uniref:glycosyl hydrolase n=1 Tax=Olivibacter sitiensis TaxID=376470 RepID=UPI0009FC73A7|nr:glycosyl hydrolase [Olivibacter sitiensis]
MKKILIPFLIMVLGAFAPSCKKDKNIEEISARSPKFLYSTPADGSEDIMLDSEVSLVYNTPIVLNETIAIKVNDETVKATVDDRKLLLEITLEQSSSYEITIPNGAVTNVLGEPAEAISLSFQTVSSFKRYEAENASLTGNASVGTSLANFSGAGYVEQKDGDIVFEVTVPESALYGINIRFSNNNEKKENDLLVNGQKLATLVFDPTNDWKTIFVNKLSLRSGKNTIIVQKNWGWMNVDYIEITPREEETSFNIDANLVTVNPSAQAANVYNFLKENFGKKVISGAMANYSYGLEEATWMQQNTGKWPALAGFDFINHTRDWSITNADILFDNVKEYWDNNGLVTLMWHWRNPLKTDDEFYTDRTSFDVSKVTNTSSSEYQAMIADIDVIAGYLKQFKDANIPVLWRPLHEASGKWFWWGAKGPEACKTLWKLMYSRLVHHHGLNNLIWIWTSDAAGDALDWYPGHDYVDIIGMDIYPGENQHGSQYIAFDKMKELYEGRKIVALTECGSIPQIDAMYEYEDVWSWFMPWNGDYTRAANHNGAAFLNAVFGNANVISREQMPSLK